MLSMFVAGFSAIFTVKIMALMVLGVGIGIIFGAIPGLTAAMAVALMLPITFGLDAISGFALLIALYIGGISGGLISAVLINIPGTPSSIATTFDGAPMAKNGEGGRALGIGVFYAFLGTIFSIAILIFVAPPLANVALQFGAFEYFSLAVFALTLIAGIAGKSMLKGLAAGFIGMALATVGAAPIDGLPRFTFGIHAFDAGFDLLPALVGLYAISEILKSAESQSSITEVAAVKTIKGFGFSWQEFKGQFGNFVRSSLIGTGIGILPGIGGSTSNILSYIAAKKSSKYPEKFGTGIMDGVVASEAGANASVGGAMVPLLTLGIPGDGVTAMLLGGFMIHGLTPGPLLFANNGKFVYAIFAALIAASIIMLVMEFYGMKLFIKLLKIPKGILLPIVLVLCAVGAYATNNTLFGVWTLLIFGFLGYALDKFGYPLPPVILREYVPQGHKVALSDIAQEEPVIRYGEVIGYAVRSIQKGWWIDESLIKLPTPPKLDDLPLANKVAETLSPLEGYTFKGYRNNDGSVGIRNILGIITGVQCVAGVLDYAVKRIKEEILLKYPNVDDVVALNHTYGCGVAIDAPEAIIPIRTLRNIATHPNLGGELMVVGLGCEKLLPEKLISGVDSANIVVLQEQQGFMKMVQAIINMAEQRLIRLNRRERVTCPVSDLMVGLQCGGSDAFSGVTANPAVGYLADLLVRAGATVLFSEVTEVRDAVHLLTPRAVSEEVGRALIREMKWYDDYLQRGEADRSANPSPGNKKGGLANVVEKSLGSIAKSGSSPIVGVTLHGEKATQKGLIFAATPASDFICGTLQLAAGMNLQVFTTGRGTPYGLAMAPVIKVSTRNSLTEQWADLIDVNAGRIATGEAKIADVGWEIFHLILDVASGRKQTWAEQWGLHNSLSLFNPAPVT